MPQPFEASNAWCYHFSRYDALPEILQMPEVTSGEPFRLVELSRQVIGKYMSVEQQRATYVSAQAKNVLTVGGSIRWYIPFIARNTNQLVPIGGGMFRLPTASDVDQDELESEAIDNAIDDDIEAANDLSGWLYAFSFPLIMKTEGRFPIKIGRTAGDVKQRVDRQCRQSAVFEQPTILKSWPVKHVGAAELAVHNVLRYRGRWRSDALGAEWFDTTITEIEAIVAFL